VQIFGYNCQRGGARSKGLRESRKRGVAEVLRGGDQKVLRRSECGRNGGKKQKFGQFFRTGPYLFKMSLFVRKRRMLLRRKAVKGLDSRRGCQRHRGRAQPFKGCDLRKQRRGKK